MTTSLPTTSTNDLLPAAPSADGLAALLSATPATAASPDAAGKTPAEFTTLLDGSVPAAIPAATVAPVALSVAATSVPSWSPAKNAPRLASGTPVLSETQPSATTDARGLAFSVSGASASPAVRDAAAICVPAGPSDTETTPALPDRATLEAIVALLVPLAAVATPVQPNLALGGQATAAAPDLPTSACPTESPTLGQPPVVVPTGAQVTVALPGQNPVVLDETFSPASRDSRPAEAPLETPAVTKPNLEATEPLAAIARAVPSTIAEHAVAETLPSQPAVEASASVELSDGAVISLELPRVSVSARPAVHRGEATHELGNAFAAQSEKSAAVAAQKNPVNSVPENAAGKNFLTAEEQPVKPLREEAGIGVAQTRSTMLFALHDTISAAHPTVPALVSMVPAAADVAAAPASEPMPPLVAASLAHRAVETVTSVVDAQAASKLQPVPSVQLKFKFGAEDLAVRVALRDGVVHTEFRTDSPELRAAIQNEWKAVTAQPESALRFLDPVVAPASSSQSGANGFAQQQHQQSPGQSAAQQQHHQHQHQQSRAATELFGSVARSTPFQPRDGGAASNVVPVVLPTSVHLSAVA